MKGKVAAAFGSWKSPITTELMVSSSIAMSEARLFDSTLYWLESRPQEQGRSVIVRLVDDKPEDVLPQPYNCRTTVHEYGGSCYLPTPEGLFFVNFADQQIWQLGVTGRVTGRFTGTVTGRDKVRQVTRQENYRFADLAWCQARRQLIAIAEEHNPSFDEPANSLVAVDVGVGKIQTLHSGEDFYASASFSPDGKSLVWLTWSHPDMPWDSTKLWFATIDDNGQLIDPRVIAGGDGESLFQPKWSPAGELYFVSDKTNWWNLYHWRDGAVTAVHPMDAEFGRPQWQFGMTSYGFVDSNTIVCAYSQSGVDTLALLDVNTGALTRVDRPHSSYGSLRAEDGMVCYIAQSPTSFPTLVCCHNKDSFAEKTIRSASSIALEEEHYSIGKPISYPTAGGQQAHGFFYAPANADYQGLDNELPPLIVMIHGGPTSATQNDLALKIQFWTNRGFAVLDVNYRGSTGFGRQYRDALKGQWGVADVEDCDYGVRYLVEQKEVDPQRVAIRGGSAGGYTTLAALAHTDTFKAGASLYGVTDLAALATDTHKFESRYLDSLIGPWPQEKALYASRSPINHADSINSPVIFLQGLEDKVVPPSQAEAMVAALERNGVKTAYVPFEGESHGFRKSENIRRAFDLELAFYGDVFGFSDGDSGS